MYRIKPEIREVVMMFGRFPKAASQILEHIVRSI